MDQVKVLILFSGKRKSGKDYISELLYETLGNKISQIIRISEPIKAEWAKTRHLDLKKLLSDGPYKENYRKEMIEWSNGIRSKDYGFFCRKAIQNINTDIVIVSDTRRKNDLRFFREEFGAKVKTIRVVCSDEERIKRGWQFQEGIDDIDSECDLDDVDNWDFLAINEDQGGEQIVKDIIDKFLSDL